MVAVEILARLHELSVEIVLIDGGEHARLRPGKNPIPPDLIEDVRRHKDELRELVRDREAVVRHAEEMLVQARAIREGRFPLPEIAVCQFHIGKSGARCKRCGAPWLEHFAPPATAQKKRGVA